MYWIPCIDDVAAEVAAAGYQQKYGISDISSLLFSLGLEIPLIWEKNAVNPPWGAWRFPADFRWVLSYFIIDSLKWYLSLQKKDIRIRKLPQN